MCKQLKYFMMKKIKIIEIERIQDIAKPEDTDTEKPQRLPGMSQE